MFLFPPRNISSGPLRDLSVTLSASSRPRSKPLSWFILKNVKCKVRSNIYIYIYSLHLYIEKMSVTKNGTFSCIFPDHRICVRKSEKLIFGHEECSKHFFSRILITFHVVQTLVRKYLHKSNTCCIQ